MGLLDIVLIMTTKPVFDFSVPDWEYLALTSTSLLVGPPDFAKKGEVDIMTLFYRDGYIKIRTRVLFPSGSKLMAENNFPGCSLDECIEKADKIIENFPGFVKGSSYRTIIYNTTTKGQDLFDLILKNQNIECKFTVQDN